MRFKFSLGNLPALGKWVTLAIKLVVTALVVFYLYNSIEIDKLGLHLADSSLHRRRRFFNRHTLGVWHSMVDGLQNQRG